LKYEKKNNIFYILDIDDINESTLKTNFVHNAQFYYNITLDLHNGINRKPTARTTLKSYLRGLLHASQPFFLYPKTFLILNFAYS